MISRFQEEEGLESEEEEQILFKVFSFFVLGIYCLVFIKIFYLVFLYNFFVWYIDYIIVFYFIYVSFQFLFIKSFNYYIQCFLIVFLFNFIIMFSYMDIIYKKGYLWWVFLVNQLLLFQLKIQKILVFRLVVLVRIIFCLLKFWVNQRLVIFFNIFLFLLKIQGGDSLYRILRRFLERTWKQRRLWYLDKWL